MANSQWKKITVWEQKFLNDDIESGICLFDYRLKVIRDNYIVVYIVEETFPIEKLFKF